jgi:hypothetical protein
MGRAEASFEHRVQKRFEETGCIVINASRSRPVDLVVFPPPSSSRPVEFGPTRPIMVELKARTTNAPREQEVMQRGLAKRAGCNYIRLRQGKLRGYVILEAYETYPPDDEGDLAALLNAVFGRERWRVSPTERAMWRGGPSTMRRRRPPPPPRATGS